MKRLRAATKRYTPLVPLLLLAPYLAVQFALATTLIGLSNAWRPTHGLSSTRCLQNESTRVCGPRIKNSYVPHGGMRKAAQCHVTTPNIFVLDVEPLLMKPRNMLEFRRLKLLTLYKVEAWTHKLNHLRLSKYFARISDGLLFGLKIDFPLVDIQTLPNRPSIVKFEADFHTIIQKEIEKGRYIGPFKAEVLEHLIGPSQTTPLSIIPKPRNQGNFISFRTSHSHSHQVHSSLICQ